ncbi:MAG: flippase-like domain-containing protein [Deltaproteobacteria bacterium]|nr:flippase-like domain-containing protein [Deltaproteobacteria bacterium]
MDGTQRSPVVEQALWRRLAPFVVATVLLAWVLRDIDRADLRASLHHVRLPHYLGVLIALAAATLVIDVATSLAIYRRMLGPLRFADLLAVRAASFLPGLINYHVGQAWLTWVLVRRRGNDLHRAVGATLVINATTLAALMTITALAMLRGPPVGVDWLLALVIVGVIGALTYLAVLALRPAALLSRRSLAPIFELGVRGHLWAFAIRLPSVVASFAVVWIPLRCFGVDIPLLDALRVVPPVVVLAALPITPAGLGTRDAVAAALLVGFAAGSPEQQRATIVACTLTTAIGLSVIQLVVALLFIPRARRLQRTG